MNSLVTQRPKLAMGRNETFNAARLQSRVAKSASQATRRHYGSLDSVFSHSFVGSLFYCGSFRFPQKSTETRKGRERNRFKSLQRQSRLHRIVALYKLLRKRNSRVFLSHLNCGWRCNKRHSRAF